MIHACLCLRNSEGGPGSASADVLVRNPLYRWDSVDTNRTAGSKTEPFQYYEFKGIPAANYSGSWINRLKNKIMPDRRTFLTSGITAIGSAMLAGNSQVKESLENPSPESGSNYRLPAFKIGSRLLF
jgi:hypothetical protein